MLHSNTTNGNEAIEINFITGSRFMFMNAPCLGLFCCQVLAFVCFFVVTFNIDAKLFCLYQGGFIY